MEDCHAESEYFMMRSEDLVFRNVHFKGKYSFQYIKNAVLKLCVRHQGRFLAWRKRDGENSVVKGSIWPVFGRTDPDQLQDYRNTAPVLLQELKLIDCEMEDTDLCFEKSDVEATITTPVISIKNPLSGSIRVPQVGEVIRDDGNSRGEIVVGQ